MMDESREKNISMVGIVIGDAGGRYYRPKGGRKSSAVTLWIGMAGNGFYEFYQKQNHTKQEPSSVTRKSRAE